MVHLSWPLRPNREKGFSLFETVVAVLMAVLFFLLVLQASTLSSTSKVQTQEAIEVMNWLQRDTEVVKLQASTLQLANIESASWGDDKVYLKNLNDLSRFREGDIISFMTNSPDGKTYTITDINNNANGFIQLSSKLQASYPSNSLIIVRSRQQASVATSIPLGSYIVYSSSVENISPGSQLMFGELDCTQTRNPSEKQKVSQQTYDVLNVVKGFIQVKQPLKTNLSTSNSVNLARCKATQFNNGYADELRDQLVVSDQNSSSSKFVLAADQTKTSRGKQFTITRVMAIVDSPPYNVLQVHYEISPQLSETVSLDSFITRVMPDVAFYCS